MKVYIFGAGGSGREVLCLVRGVDRSLQRDSAPEFVVDDEYHTADTLMGVPVMRRSQWRPEFGQVVVAVGDPAQRRKIVESLPGAEFATFVHPSVIAWEATIGPGSIITANCILTCNIRLGAHTHLNIATSISHDCVAGDFLTTAPGVRVCGNVTIGEGVDLGASASVREKVSIASGVTVGMGAAVVCDLTEPGTYVGVPARPLIR